MPVSQQIHVVSNQLNCSPLSRTICKHPMAKHIATNPTISKLFLSSLGIGFVSGRINFINIMDNIHNGILIINTHCQDI